MTWLMAIIGIAALIVIHEAGHAIAARACGMKVTRFALFFPPVVVRKRIGETEFAIGAIPLGGYVRIAGQSPEDVLPTDEQDRSYANRPIWQRSVVILAGPLANILAAMLIITALLAINGVTKVDDRVAAGSLEAPAAGLLRPGDRIVSVDGRSGSVEQLVRATRTHSCAGRPTPGCQATTPAVVVVERSGETLRLRIRPRWDASNRAMRLGFTFASVRQRLPLDEAVSRSASVSWRVAGDSLKGLAAIATPEGRRQVSGIVGVSVVTERAFSDHVVDALQLLALISLLIAIFNLLPFLPLDGGHLFWLAVERIRGRPASPEILGKATAAGMVLVLALFFIGLSNDILRLGGEGFPTGK